MFQDSPTCLNFDSAQPRKACSQCVLMQLVPEVLRSKKIPCRYIPLDEQGQTVDSFYRFGTQEELETAVAQWLKNMITHWSERSQTAGRTPSVPRSMCVRGS